MKNLLLEGCRISYGYKKKPEDWVGMVSIYIIGGGFGMVPHVIVSTNGDNTTYSLDELDKAILDFNKIAFSPENLWFKNNEAMRILSVLKTRLDRTECQYCRPQKTYYT